MANLTYTTQQIQDKLDQISDGSKSYKSACLLGDSITGQHNPIMTIPVVGSQGFWNWANYAIGSPFVFSCNLGVSGDTAEGIFSRAWQIPQTIDTVFLLAGTNNIVGFSSSANQAAIDAEIIRLSGVFTDGLTKLKNAGKKVCIATIPPNNTMTTGTDSRIALLDGMNTFILGLKSAGLVNEVADIFTPMWDSTQPTLRKFKTNASHTDGTHLSNVGAQLAGTAISTQVKTMYAASNSVVHPFDDYVNQISLLSQFRDISGVTSLISFGSGTLGGGWRSLNNGAGTPTLVLSNTENFSITEEYVGPSAHPVCYSEKWQKLTITNAIDASSIRLQLKDFVTLYGGESIAAAVDMKIESHTNLKSIAIHAFASTTNGTTPADQPFTATANNRTTCNNTSNATPEYVYQIPAFRGVLVTQKLRVPENINSTVTIQGQLYVDITFGGAGEAVVYVARPQFLRKIH